MNDSIKNGDSVEEITDSGDHIIGIVDEVFEDVIFVVAPEKTYPCTQAIKINDDDPRWKEEEFQRIINNAKARYFGQTLVCEDLQPLANDLALVQGSYSMNGEQLSTSIVIAMKKLEELPRNEFSSLTTGAALEGGGYARFTVKFSPKQLSIIDKP